MSNDTGALAPQDADVTPIPQAQPDGAEPKAGNEADPSPAVASKPSETIEPETNRLSERFAELTRLRRDAERDRDHWRDLAMRTPEKPKEPEPTAALAAGKVKTLADFNFDEGAHQAYVAERAAQAASDRIRQELKAENEKQQQQRKLAEYVSKAREYAKDKPDFDDVTRSAPISKHVADTIIELAAPEIAEYLGRNHDIAVRISELPERVSAFELGQIAARIRFDREAAAKAKAQVSAAPQPAPKIDATAAAPVRLKSTDEEAQKLSGNEWRKLREKELAARRK